MKTHFCILLLAALVPIGFRAACGAEEPKEFEVHDWFILVADPRSNANDDKFFNSTMPNYIKSARERETGDAANHAMPHGMITFYGKPEEDAEAILNLRSNGRFYAHWPPAKVRSKRLSWLAIETNPEINKDAGVFEPLDEKHWMSIARKGPAQYITHQRKIERFLVYDARMNYPLPLELSGGGSEPFKVTVKAGSKLTDVYLYQPDGEGWKREPVAELADGSHRFEKLEAADEGVILGDWKTRLSADGLFDHEVEVILEVLKHHGLSREELSLVYQLDLEGIEALLPLEIYPYPEKTVRVGLVILKGIDPSRTLKLDSLITQLGDDSWKARESAFNELKEMGKDIIPKLKTALESKDEEVVYRAERLIFLADPPLLQNR